MILEDLGHDLRYAARTLLRSPGFAAVAVLAIGLGIGANSAIFSVLNAVVLRPLPYHQPDRIVTVLHDGPRIPERLKRQCPVSPADYLDWRAQNQVFESIAAAQAGSNATLSGRGQVETLKTMQVAPQLFPLLGVTPLLGRTFLPDEDRPGAGRVVVLSHGLWQRRFGADPALVGQTVTLDGDSHTVVGIMPPAFQFAPFWWRATCPRGEPRASTRSSRFVRSEGRI